jgi:hypothetical protein
MKSRLRTVLFAFLLAGVAGMLTGCLTDDTDERDSKPWNAPQSWEGPMPSTINQGR